MNDLIGNWGLPIPDEMRDKIAATWGARAIYISRIIDLLPDRQSWTVASASQRQGKGQRFRGPLSGRDDEKLDRLKIWINAKGLPFLQKEATTLYGDENRVVAMDDGLFHIEASPQSSHGYLYIRAWELRPQQRERGTITLDQTSKESIASELDRQS